MNVPALSATTPLPEYGWINPSNHREKMGQVSRGGFSSQFQIKNKARNLLVGGKIERLDFHARRAGSNFRYAKLFNAIETSVVSKPDVFVRTGYRSATITKIRARATQPVRVASERINVAPNTLISDRTFAYALGAWGITDVGVELKVEQFRDLLVRKLRSAVSEFAHLLHHKKSDIQQLTFRSEKGSINLAERLSALLFRFYGIAKNAALEQFICEDLIDFVECQQVVPIGKIGNLSIRDGNVILSLLRVTDKIDGDN